MIKEIYKTKEEWLKHRGIGGSSASAIMGVSKWATVQDIYDDLALNRRKADKKNSRMDEGSKAESLIRQLFALEHPEFEVIEPEGYWQFRDEECEFLTVTPDGLLYDKNTKTNGGLEIKDVELRKQADKDKWLNGIIPDYYLTQLIQYFIILKDIKFMVLLARLKIYAGSELDHVETRCYMLRREGMALSIKEQREREIEFVEEHIKPKIRPSIDIKI